MPRVTDLGKQAVGVNRRLKKTSCKWRSRRMENASERQGRSFKANVNAKTAPQSHWGDDESGKAVSSVELACTMMAHYRERRRGGLLFLSVQFYSLI